MAVFFVIVCAVAEFFMAPQLRAYQGDPDEIKQAIQKIHKLLCVLFVNPQNIEATEGGCVANHDVACRSTEDERATR